MNWDDQQKILEIIKSLNAGGAINVCDTVNCAIKQYEYFKKRMKDIEKD